MSPRSSVKSADRVLDILELLAFTGREMTHAEIARRIDIPKSSLTHLLRNLVQRGYADGAFALARRGANTRTLITHAKPCLERLTAATGESSALSLLQAEFAERVCSVDSARAVFYAMHVGVRAPLYANSAGKVLLAWMTPSEREAYLSRVELQPITPKTIRSVARLRRELERIRSEGFAYSLGEFTPGIVGMATAVLDAHGRALAAVGVALPVDRFNEARRPALEKALRACAREVARRASEA